MINSRKQGQSTTTQSAAAHQLGQNLVPQIQIHNHSNLASVNTRKFTPNAQGLSARGAGTVLLGNKRMMDARDRLSLKRSISGIQAQASTPPLKITKTIQVIVYTWICKQEEKCTLYVIVKL